MNDTRLPPPALDWEQGEPVHRGYADPYFSRTDGLAESRYVFLQANRLAARFASCQQFAIGELGFGTGLNFLLSWQLWRDCAPAGALLTYVAVEAAPLTAEQISHALSRWPELAPLRERLCARLPPASAGFHLVVLDYDVRLLLLYGDVADVLPRCRARVDAWFLDGFAPARNPAMWAPAVMEQLARLSRPGASFATYSAAGAVRRALASAGFSVQKHPGFGHKRHMIAGHIDQASAESVPPWFTYPDSAENQTMTVLGDGLAGACLARHLAESGRAVELIGGAPGASRRIPGLLVRPYPQATATPADRLYRQAFHYAASTYQRWAPEACETLPLRSAKGTLPALILRGVEAVDRILDHPLIEQRHGEVVRIDRDARGWRLHHAGNGAAMQTGVLMLCTGELPAGLNPALPLPLRPCAGQVITLAGRLEQAFADKVHGFALGATSQIGSSYRHDERDLAPRDEDSQRILREAADRKLLVGLKAPRQALSAATGLRIVTPDHLPLIGPAPNLPRWAENYAHLLLGRPRSPYPAADWLDGLWLNLGHGSRGATMAPLAGAQLAAALTNQPLPLPVDLLEAVHPGRFAIRSMKRGQGVNGYR